MLLGPNGSGKSTLIRCLGTALRPHHGTVHLGGHNLWEERAALRSRIAYLGHQPHLYDDLSGPENLSVWARLGGYTPDIPALLARVGLDPDRRDPVRTFSAGMRRRLALARILLKSPNLVLLDEPFTALDPAGRLLLMEVIRSLQDSGATLLMATHHPSVARQVCGSALILDAGKVVYSGAIDGMPESVMGAS